MSEIVSDIATNNLSSASHLHELMDQCEQILLQHRAENPGLYRLVELRKAQAKTTNNTAVVSDEDTQTSEITTPETKAQSILSRELRGGELRAKIRASYQAIRQERLSMNAEIIPRTQAHNRKSSYATIEEEREFRAEVVTEQIRAWRSVLPTLIRRLSKIPDPRRTKSIKHKLTVLLLFGLFAFIFRLSSRREMNRELTTPTIHENLKKIFPDIESIPHADTLARLLEKIDPKSIEEAHINLVRDLINKKKFKKLLIYGCIPITVDGTQKLYRNNLLQDPRWCERKVGDPESGHKQQYIYTIEANITLRNGLTIPLLTEYLYRENNQLIQPEGKQDSETTAFERMAERLKQYFPRLKMIFFMDALYATQTVMGILDENQWEYIIGLPRRKLTELAKILNQNKSKSQSIPGQPGYRKRKQAFYWENNIEYGYEGQLTIHLASCLEQYYEVDKKTGEIVERYSEHSWISSIPVNIQNVHELFNCGARNKALIEECFNTEKNRGYRYKHAFSYDWNAMQGFHYLMRLGHLINALSEFTKKLKRYIRDLGCSPTLKIIKETLFSTWLPPQWYAEQQSITAQLRLQLE